MRTRGVPVLVNDNLEVVNAETGAQAQQTVSPSNYPVYSYLSASGNGKALYSFSIDTTNCQGANRYDISNRPRRGPTGMQVRVEDVRRHGHPPEHSSV